MATIEKITNFQLPREAWESIFVSDDPFGWPFRANIESRMLFYPTEGYHLSEEQYCAVLEAANAIGDIGFFVSIIEGQGEIMNRGDHWCCEFPSYQQYLNLPLVLENAIYSRNSNWGIMISHEDHAVVGGSSAFVNKLKVEYPAWKNELNDLKKTWKGNANAEWLSEVID